MQRQLSNICMNEWTDPQPDYLKTGYLWGKKISMVGEHLDLQVKMLPVVQVRIYNYTATCHYFCSCNHACREACSHLTWLLHWRQWKAIWKCIAHVTPRTRAWKSFSASSSTWNTPLRWVLYQTQTSKSTRKMNCTGMQPQPCLLHSTYTVLASLRRNVGNLLHTWQSYVGLLSIQSQDNSMKSTFI